MVKKIYTNEIPLEGESKFLRIEMYYDLGGFNFFTYQNEARGYYVSATPVERRRGSGRYTVESTAAFSGLKQCILECERQSRKREEEALALMNEHFENLVAAVLKKNGLRVGGAS